MTSMSEIFQEIARITRDEEKNLLQLALKTSEETGELAQAVLSFTQAPGCAYKNKTARDVEEEAVDVILCAAATLFKTNDINRYVPYSLTSLFEIKLKAWEEKIIRERRDTACADCGLRHIDHAPDVNDHPFRRESK